MKNKMQNPRSRDIEINLVPMLKALLSKLWLMALVGLILGGVVFGVTKMLVKPTYRSGFTAYVNNQQAMDNKESLTYSDLNAAKQLVSTYQQIIKSNQILSAAAEKCDPDLTYGQVSGMVKAEVLGETEIISVSVTSNDPDLSYELAKAIAQVAPEKMGYIVEGSSMKIIDEPVKITAPYGPSYFRFAVLGFLAGVLIVLVKTIIDFFKDDKIKSEHEIEEQFDIPILGVIPDITASGSGKGYYESSYGYQQNVRSETENE